MPHLQGCCTPTWTHGAGAEMTIAATAIDSGGHHTDAVYTFSRKMRGRRVIPIKGMGQEGRPLLGRPSKANKQKVPLYPCGPIPPVAQHCASRPSSSWIASPPSSILPGGHPKPNSKWAPARRNQKMPPRILSPPPVLVQIHSRGSHSSLTPAPQRSLGMPIPPLSNPLNAWRY